MLRETWQPNQSSHLATQYYLYLDSPSLLIPMLAHLSSPLHKDTSFHPADMCHVHRDMSHTAIQYKSFHMNRAGYQSSPHCLNICSFPEKEKYTDSWTSMLHSSSSHQCFEWLSMTWPNMLMYLNHTMYLGTKWCTVCSPFDSLYIRLKTNRYVILGKGARIFFLLSAIFVKWSYKYAQLATSRPISGHSFLFFKFFYICIYPPGK